MAYWQQDGGLPQLGYAISDELEEVAGANGNTRYAGTRTVQYFERALLEYHPENRPPYDVLLSRLGASQYKRKYPNGAPNQKANKNNARYFPETGHTVGGGFRQYWEKHGGLM